MATDPLFGWDLTFKTIESDIRRKSDILIAFIHWNLTKRGFRSIGIGDESTVREDEAKSELLPAGWNENDNYTIRYILEDKLYVMHGLNTDGNLIVNLMRSEDLAVSNLAVKIDDTVKKMNGPINKMMPDHKDIMHNIKRDLIDTITQKPSTAVETQTSTSNSSSRRSLEDPLRVPPGLSPHPGARPGSAEFWGRLPPHVGGSDLDPFAPVGSGGMLFNPFAPHRHIENPGHGIPGGLPRGAVPPGARFDPFGPPGAGPMPGRRPAPPDADHMPPPGFNDNMFL